MNSGDCGSRADEESALTGRWPMRLALPVRLARPMQPVQPGATRCRREDVAARACVGLAATGAAEAAEAAEVVGTGEPLRAASWLACLPAVSGAVALAALLAACAEPADVQGRAPVHAAAALSKDAPESYTAETTYAKLAPNYPFIRIASREVPASVQALRNITYATPDGRALQLDLYLPARQTARRAAGPVAGIVFVHGGGWRVGVRDNFAPMAIRMAERGYAAATISYRLSTVAPYPAAIQDAKAAVRWMRANAARYGIDPQRIAIGGGSAGGQIAALAGVSAGVAKFEPDADAGAAAASSAVQAIVNIDGLSDFTSEATRKYEDDPAKQPSSAGAWFGGRYAEKSALWREASPLFYVNATTPPIVFIGSAQPRFSLGRTEMVDKMQALGIPTQVVVLPDTPHSFWLFDPWLEPTVQAAADFLDRVLVPRSGG